MTLTLDEVRQVQFHESRRRGYEVTDVDLFVDRVEASFEQLIEENTALKQEIEALKSAKGSAASDPAPAQAQSRSVTDDTAEQPAVRPEADKVPAQQPSAQQPAALDSTPGHVVVTTSAEASPAVIRLVQMATDQAETLVNEAEAQAARTRESADTQAQQVLEDANREARTIGADASTRAERIESEARANAEKVRGDAQDQADNLNADLEKRRVEMFTDLDRERETLVSSVAQLREFEKSYRGNLTEHLQGQLEAVRNGNFEPDEVPALANSNRSRAGSADSQDSSTPRLDALLGDRDDS